MVVDVLLGASDRMEANVWRSESLVEAVLWVAHDGKPATPAGTSRASRSLHAVARVLPWYRPVTVNEAVDMVFAWDCDPSTAYEDKITICREAARDMETTI